MTMLLLAVYVNLYKLLDHRFILYIKAIIVIPLLSSLLNNQPSSNLSVYLFSLWLLSVVKIGM